jgi:hypothetical protein
MSQIDPSVASIKNARQMPKVYYGLHFYPGVAEYPGKASDGTPNRLLVTESAIRNMEASFTGKPVYVQHINGSPDLGRLQAEADGYVIESFFNPADGKHWAKLLIVSDEGHAAVAKGWRLSNAYRPNAVEKKGVWNSIPYQVELLGGEFEHMALVERPRYNESVILTPEEFAKHNEKHLEDLKRHDIKNSEVSEQSTPTKKEGALTMAFNFFKKTPVEADKDTLVTLKNGKSMSLEQLVEAVESSLANDGDETESVPTPVMGSGLNSEEPPKEEKKEDKSEAGEAKGEAPNKEEAKEQGDKQQDGGVQPEMANPEHHVMVNGASMKLGDLLASHARMTECMNALSEHHAKMAGGQVPAAAPLKEADPAAMNSEEPASSDSSDDFMEGIFGENGKTVLSPFEILQNAHAGKSPEELLKKTAPAPMAGGVELGKVRYGSK